MNAAVLMESCPDPETLSAFIDQKLDPESRHAVVKHLAECGDCRDLVVAANEYRVENAAGSGKVAAGLFGIRWIVPLAAAASIVIVLFGIREGIFGGNEMSLIEAANSLPKRTTDARLSGDFAYKEYRPSRGEGERAKYQVELAALRAEQRAQENPTPAILHEAGVGHILMRDRDKAVGVLRAANAGAPSAAILTDLSAAYIVRGDYQLALDAANRSLALERTPAATWNRAIALKWLERDKEAVEAWRMYLELDPSSPWAEEVRTEHLPLLQEH